MWFLSLEFPIRVFLIIHENELEKHIPFGFDKYIFSMLMFGFFAIIGCVFFVTGIEFRRRRKKKTKKTIKETVKQPIKKTNDITIEELEEILG